MVKRKKVKVSYTKKLTWLRKKGVKFRKTKPSKTTVDRYYSVIKKRGENIPKDIMAGNIKRLQTKIEKHGEKATIRTPKGKISAKEYVREIDKQSINKILSRISPMTQVQDVYFNKHIKAGKVRDTFKYIIRPPIVTNMVMRRNAEARMTIEVREIMKIIDIIWKERGHFYSDSVIGALIFSNAENVPNPPPPYGVEFNTYEKFASRLHNMVKVLYSNVFNNYPDAIIEIFRIDVFISTAGKLSNLSKLRSR
jgi:hypothetical protein